MRWSVFTLVLLAAAIRAAEVPSGCAVPVEAYFADEVWAKVGAVKCLVCHKAGGEAEESQFQLSDPQRSQAPELALRRNRDAFARMSQLKDKDQPRLLLKATGGLSHGGKDILLAGSAEHRILAGFVRRVNAPAPTDLAVDAKAPPFFAGIIMLDDRALLRRVTLSLAGRLPTAAELTALKEPDALPKILDALMTDDAFFTRLREGFNDVFLTLGVEGNPDQNVLSYEHFPNRLWYQKFDLSPIQDQTERKRAGYKLADDYRKALLDEPMRLIEHIVRAGRPFTEIVTADYVMLNPHTARGYGVYDAVKDRFRDTKNTNEFIPVKLKALAGRRKAENQDSATGYYPHAGLLSTFQYLARYPTTETNRNRLRARVYYQHFLGIDVLELAARVSDAAAVSAKYVVPTMQASECVVCHKTLDPVAGLFQDYWRFAEKGVYGKRKGGWFADMFAPGFEGEPLPPSERWRSLQWLGERTAEDPRFATAMVEHVYYILTGRRVLLPPKDLDDPLYPAKRRAYAEQRRQTAVIASRFAKNNFNLKGVFHDWIRNDFYRADGIASAVKDPKRRAELEDVGLVRLLGPEQVERKLEAVFGERWGRLNDQMAKLYGGIDSKEVTERATDPSGAMGAIQRILSNDVASKQVPRDFAKPASERRLFPGLEPDVRPGAGGDVQIRATIVHLHERVLGRQDALNSVEVERTYKLFAGILEDAAQMKGLATAADPHYTLRAWRGVLTYLLRRPEFLYE